MNLDNPIYIVRNVPLNKIKLSKKTPEIKIDQERMMEFSKSMENEGFKMETYQENVDPGKISDYFKAINKILPPNYRFEQEVNPNHQYSMFNCGDLVQIVDKTENTAVLQSCKYSVKE